MSTDIHITTRCTPENNRYHAKGIQVAEHVQCLEARHTWMSPRLHVWRNVNNPREWRAAVEGAAVRLEPWYSGPSTVKALDALLDALPQETRKILQDRRRRAQRVLGLFNRIEAVIQGSKPAEWRTSPEVLRREIVHQPKTWEGEVVWVLQGSNWKRPHSSTSLFSLEMTFGPWDPKDAPRVQVKASTYGESYTVPQMRDILKFTQRVQVVAEQVARQARLFR